jgi:hypothetical protein
MGEEVRLRVTGSRANERTRRWRGPVFGCEADKVRRFPTEPGWRVGKSLRVQRPRLAPSGKALFLWFVSFDSRPGFAVRRRSAPALGQQKEMNPPKAEAFGSGSNSYNRTIRSTALPPHALRCVLQQDAFTGQLVPDRIRPREITVLLRRHSLVYQSLDASVVAF